MSTRAIVFFLTSEWARYHRPGLLKAVARAYAATGPVLVVNNPICLTTGRWHRPERWAAWKNRPQGTPRMVSVAENLFLLDAVIPVHDKIATHVPGLPLLNRSVLKGQIRRALDALGASEVQAAWFQFPTSVHYVGALHEHLSIYECYDEHSDIPGISARARRKLQHLEAELLRKVGLVFVTSKPLLESRSAQHPRTVLSYNAADVEFFAPIAQHTLRTVAQRDLQRPTVGYLGTIHAHTDIRLVAEMAALRPEWNFLLVGPQHPGVDTQALSQLQSLPNVRMHGWVEESTLVQLMPSIDVGIIPYRTDSVFNRFVNPNKLHEYTAMGKPVVASVGLDLSSHTGLVTAAQGVHEFVQGIEAAHRNNSLQAVQERLQFAALNSWDARAGQMLRHIHHAVIPHAKGA
jgi:glycosyltransferase involved in cell wall biosynthesis